MTLLDLIESYGYETEHRGIEQWMPCPFHEDGDPSFSVSPTEEGHVWWCFSCKRGGGAVQFIQYHDHVSPREAKATWDKLNGREPVIDPDREVLTKRTGHYTKNLKDSEAMRFFEERGITYDTLRHYSIGYDVGLIAYPFMDYDGTIKFHTRSVKEKSYRSEGGHMLWGLYQIQHGVEEVWIVEGYQDVLSCYQAGIPAVCMCGTVMHREYWDQLRDRGVRKVVFCPDGDKAGVDLLVKLSEEDPHHGISARFSVMTADADPDSWLDTHDELPQKQHPILWYVDHKWGSSYTIESKVNMYDKIAPLVARLDVAEREAISPHFKQEYGEDAIDYLHGSIKPDLQSEALVIGNCLYLDTIRLETISEVDSRFFHTKAMREAFVLIADHETPTPELIRSLTGEEYPTDPLNYKEYVARVKDIGVMEQIEKTLARARSLIRGGDPSVVLGQLVESLYETVDSNVHVYNSFDVVKQVMLDINERVENPSVVGIPLNEERFPVINRSLLGFIKNKLILLSGPTGHGKTTVACNWIDDLIFVQKQEVLFFSLEMTPPELIEKQLTIQTGIAGPKLMTGSLEQAEYDRLMMAAKGMIGDKLKIVYGVYDLQKIVGIMRSQILKSKIRVVFLDYVQLVAVRNDKARWEQLMEVTKALKTQVANMGVTVVAISQLGKSTLAKDAPESSDIGGSYGMLADADVAMAVRKRSGKDSEQGSNFLFNIDKHRYGIDDILVDGYFDRNTLQIREARA